MATRGRRALATFVVLASGAWALTGPGAARADGPLPSAGPSVLGTAATGKHLTGLAGIWAGYGEISYHFQWYRCNAAGNGCLSIHGSTSHTYVLVDKDIGKTIGLTVSATDSTGTTSAYASLVGPIAPPRPLLESTLQPQVSGVPIVGRALSVSTGTWSPMPARIDYAWERCNGNGRVCAPIAGAEGSSYTLTKDDLGHALAVVVRGTNGTTVQNAFSTASPAVADGSTRGPGMIAAPVVVGAPTENGHLAATPGIWLGVGTITFQYRWYRCDGHGRRCVTLRMGVASTYDPVAADVGRTIAVTLLASDATGTTVAFASLVGPVSQADSPLVPSGTPTISGAATVAATLQAVPGGWSRAPVRFSYAWLRCNPQARRCFAIPGATHAGYVVRPGDRGHRLTVEVLASAGGATQAALAPATAPVT